MGLRLSDFGGAVPHGIAQAVIDVAPGSPGPVGIGPAMQAVERPGNEQPPVRWRHKRKIEYAGENPDTDYTRGEYPEMSFVQTRSFVRLSRFVYNDSIPADFSPACHYLRCKLPLTLWRSNIRDYPYFLFSLFSPIFPLA
jgi:hypothetical protein